MKKKLTPLAQKLRRSPTDAEYKLWYWLRYKITGYKFRRQAVIDKYIVDFVCFEKKLIIEVDGGQHNENKDDITRDQWLNSQGFKVLRFWNNEIVSDLDGVFGKIVENLEN